MRLNVYGIAEGIDEDVCVQRDISFALKQRLDTVRIKKVAIDQVAIVLAEAGRREVPDENIRTGEMAVAGVRVLAHDVVPDDGRLRIGRLPRVGGSTDLVLDLYAVPARIDDEVVLDEAANEGI